MRFFLSNAQVKIIAAFVEIKYQASSPDEAAIVKGAKELDYEFIVGSLRFSLACVGAHFPLT